MYDHAFCAKLRDCNLLNMCYQDVRPHTDYGLVTTIALLTIVALLLYHFLHQPRTANDSLPLVGRKDGWLSMLLAPLRECYWPGSKSVTEGYEKVNRMVS